MTSWSSFTRTSRGRRKNSGSIKKQFPVSSCRQLTQLLLEELVDESGIRRAFGFLHHLADEKGDHSRLAAAILFELFGICGPDSVDYLLECAGVGGLLRTSFFFVDDREIFAALEGEIVEVFEHFAADGSGFHQIG